MTNLPASVSEESAFLRLDPRIQQWVWLQGWTSLRSIQQQAIAPLLAGEQDVILAAATSAGKTEAAFFPLLTRLLERKERDSKTGFILSISPLKALINDQTERLSALCESLDLPVLGWHGDVTAGKKLRFLERLSGVLIITPESLESLFVNKGTFIPALAAAIQSIVVDELHSFIGTERGKQVQSQMHRLEVAAHARISRVGLSATLGDTALAADFLRPAFPQQVTTIDTGSEGYELRLIVRGYMDDWQKAKAKDSFVQEPDGASESFQSDEKPGSAKHAMADYLYRHLRGSNNLIFPNSRGKVEEYADRLRRRSEREGVPNEFWTHHGSLAREVREEAEAALKQGTTAATAICTTTLELGIDIGNIRSVVQIGPPPSVASLRQRLGRSGRRAGEPAILRCLCHEDKLKPDSSMSDRLRESLVQTIAMIRLLTQSWVEPPRQEAVHASTLVQQMLSVIAQSGGATAQELWTTLVSSGVFRRIDRTEFMGLLRELAAKDILQQESSGVLLPGVTGEKLINSYEFYSAFNSGEEFRLLANGRALGSIPITRPLTVGQRIIFAGRRWRVQQVETQERLIVVGPDPGGVPPVFDGLGGRVHDRVREEMRKVLAESSPVSFLDSNASAMLEEARATFRIANLGEVSSLPDGAGVLLLTWRGDWTNDALALLLTATGHETTNEGLFLRISKTTTSEVPSLLQRLAQPPAPTVNALKIAPKHAVKEKWDWVLPHSLLLRSFASSELDLDSVPSTVKQLLQESSRTRN
jgi:ATP-dependent Lhr-like helicase